ncbi:MAG: hypothetical protein JNN08_22550 [Bryobacterales bacterium]|nr:hypothetical protein [Bryobacterales bacterium]
MAKTALITKITTALDQLFDSIENLRNCLLRSQDHTQANQICQLNLKRVSDLLLEFDKHAKTWDDQNFLKKLVKKDAREKAKKSIELAKQELKNLNLQYVEISKLIQQLNKNRN